MPNQQIPQIPDEDFEAPAGITEPEHPDYVPQADEVDTQDPEAPQ